MISVAEALERVVSGVSRLPAEQVSIAEAFGRVLAVDVASRFTQPPAAVSSMDGYALRAADTIPAPDDFEVIGESAAGGGFDGHVGSGQAVRIFTGAPVPAGADAVVMQEDTEPAGEGKVAVNVTVGPGNFIRPAGMDFKAGDALLPEGRRLTARDVGLLAAMNVPWVQVSRRPRVAILATGNEVVMPGDPLGPNQILSSNSISVAAQVRAFGGEPVNLGIAQDDEDNLHRMVSGARGCDLLVTIGGASVGDYDLVRKVLGEEGFDLGFYKVAMKPGKPLVFGHVKGTPVLGLPGNSVSANVTALIFLRAAMDVMLGVPAEDPVQGSALLGRDLDANGPRQDYMRAMLAKDADGELVATPFPAQDSAMLANLAAADCLVVRPPHAQPARAGARVPIIPLPRGTCAV